MTPSEQPPSNPHERRNQPGAADAEGATGTIANSQGFGDLTPIAPGRPKNLFIAVTDRCNSRCRHCPHYHSTFGTDMSEAVMRKAIDALAQGLELIAPQGIGEPLIAKPFYMLLEALALVQRCRKEAGPECRGSLSFVFTAMKDTFGDLPDLVRMAHRYGVPSIRVQALFGNNNLDALRGQSPFEAPDAVAPASLEGWPWPGSLGSSSICRPRSKASPATTHSRATRHGLTT